MIPTPLGTSRTVVRPLYALIAPDSHVSSAESGWTKTVPFVLVSSGMGARITETLYVMEKGGRGLMLIDLEAKDTLAGAAVSAIGAAGSRYCLWPQWSLPAIG